MVRDKGAYDLISDKTLSIAFISVLMAMLIPCVAFGAWPAQGNSDSPSPTALTTASTALANEGKGKIKSQTAKCGKKIALKANKFTRSGYKFAGWNTKANGKGKSYKDRAKVKNLAKAGKTVKLYAQWKKLASHLDNSYVSSKYGSVTVGGKMFKCDYDSLSKTYTLSVTENGQTRILDTNTHYMLVTNGKYLYYGGNVSTFDTESHISAFNVTLYRMDVATGQKTYISEGVNLAAFACNGKYLYYGAHASETPYPSTLYVRDLASGKAKLIGKGISGSVCCTGKRLYASTPSMNGPARITYSFNLDGTGKRTVAKNAYLLNPTNSSIVLIYQDSSFPPKYRAYKCTINGKKTKALSDWTTDLNGLMKKYSG